MATKTPNTQQTPIAKKGSSKTGALISVMALVLAATGNALVNYRYQPEVASTTTSEKVGEAIGGGILHTLAVVLSMPMLIGVFILAPIAILLTLVKLRKVKARGWFLSAIWILLSIWALKLAQQSFALISAN